MEEHFLKIIYIPIMKYNLYALKDKNIKIFNEALYK